MILYNGVTVTIVQFHVYNRINVSLLYNYILYLLYHIFRNPSFAICGIICVCICVFVFFFSNFRQKNYQTLRRMRNIDRPCVIRREYDERMI